MVRPSARYRNTYLDALREHEAISKHPEIIREQIVSVDVFIQRQASRQASFEEFWMLSSGRYIGSFQLRKSPSDSQIYYDVRPRERRKGYGLTLFRLAIRVANARDMLPLKIKVDSENVASVRIIESCGGVDINPESAASDRIYEIGNYLT